MKLVGRLIRGLIAVSVMAVFLASIVTAWVAWRYRASVPVMEGAYEIAGATAPIRIIRDEHGVPHIFAETDADVYRALGYVHAQERLFQMDLIRRAMKGELASLLGPGMATVDARHRTLGYPQAAEALARNANDEVKAAAQAYSDGVNAFLAEPKRRRSPEFALLFADVAPWTPIDTAAVSVYMADTLATGAGDEASAVRLKDELTPTQIGEFLGAYPDFAPASLTLSDLLGAGQPEPGPEPGPELADEPGVPSDAAPIGGVESAPTPGSNNWVVNGTRTASGMPLLANDPHLALGSPSIWFFARLSLSHGNAVGATLPGAPFVILGRNDSAAWAFTNASFDVKDYVAKPAGDWEITQERTETIKVRFGRDKTITVRETPIGPILDAEHFNVESWGGQEVVLRSTVDDRDATSSDTALALMRSETWEAFVDAGRPFVAPIQSMLYADVNGDIGYHAPGRLPARDAAGAWGEPLAFADMPRVKNPASGMIATANNKIVPDDYPHAIPGEYAVYRIMRILPRLDETRRHDRASFRDLMYDTHSVHAERILTGLLRAQPETEAGQVAKEMLRTWNGDMRADKLEPLVFALVSKEMNAALFADELGEAFGAFNVSQRVFTDEVINGRLSHWCDDVTTEERRETCADTLGRAFDRAGARWQEDWAHVERWDEVHKARFPHPVLSGLPLFDRLYTVEAPMGGDGSTVNVAHFSFRNDNFSVSHAASLRAIYDFSDLDSSQFIHAPGQSGHPLSPHYSDLAPMWAAGDFIEIRTDWDEEAPPPGARLLILAPSD